MFMLYITRLFFYKQLRSEETVELQYIMEEISKMFSGRRRGTEWSVPWPYKGYFTTTPIVTIFAIFLVYYLVV